MKPIRAILLLLLHSIIACSGTESTTDSIDAYRTFESVADKPAAEIVREDGWTIVSLEEDGDRVYWFLAPDVNNVTPALFKKTVHAGGKGEPKIVIVSECEAPKQTCDDLMKQFEALGSKYQ